MTSQALDLLGFPIDQIILPDNQFQVIYADPPWEYNDKANAGKRGASHKYDCMSLEEIKAMPVQDIAAPDCALFMWWVPPMPFEALSVVEAWGFTLKNMKGFTWVKVNPKTNKAAFGMGHWTRSNSEDCLLAVRGKPKRVNAGVSQLVMAPREAHSKKPDEVRNRIVTLMGDVPRVELFARQEHEGWEAWGDEV